ncbi:hypothetical protein FF1_042790 [Malus domestica]
MLCNVLVAVQRSTTDLHRCRNLNPQKTRYLKERCQRSTAASETTAKSVPNPRFNDGAASTNHEFNEVRPKIEQI